MEEIIHIMMSVFSYSATYFILSVMLYLLNMFTFCFQTNFFNLATGLWDFPSLSEHRPKEEDDPALQRAIKKRLAVFDGAEGVVRDTKGYLTGNNPLVLFPPVLEDGCLCGVIFFSIKFLLQNSALNVTNYISAKYNKIGKQRMMGFHP